MEEYLVMKKNILIVIHDSWITRLIDMCLANSTNIISRHVPETTILRIDYNGDCYFHFPKQECQPKEFMNRDNHQPSNAFTKYGSIKAVSPLNIDCLFFGKVMLNNWRFQSRPH